MYQPRHFAQNDKARIIDLIREYPFASVITINNGVPEANHLPLLIDESSDHLRLFGHMAKSNEQWQQFDNGQEVLVIFQGPHAYISPSYYQDPGVPTWNYAVVHLYGQAKVITSPQQVKSIISDLSNKYEQYQSSPWQPEIADRILPAVIAFEILTNRIEAKYKLSQNRSEADREKIITILERSKSDGEKGVARLMRHPA